MNIFELDYVQLTFPPFWCDKHNVQTLWMLPCGWWMQIAHNLEKRTKNIQCFTYSYADHQLTVALNTLELSIAQYSRPGPSLTRGPDASLSGDSVESLCELALEKVLSLGSVSAMSERASLSSSSGWVKIQSSARSKLLFWKKAVTVSLPCHTKTASIPHHIIT